mgnify:CR=1 FL=1
MTSSHRSEVQILLVHQGFPGQFVHLLPRLLARGDQVAGIGLASNKLAAPLVKHPGFLWRPYRPDRGNGQGVHPLAVETESKVLRASWVAQVAEGLRRDGWCPDLVIGHSGWGELLFLDDVWPNVPQLHYMEFAYGTQGPDSAFDPEDGPRDDWQSRARSRMKNAAVWLSAEAMHWGVTPTAFQRSAFPFMLQQRISVIHEGIDCDKAKPDAQAKLNLPNGKQLCAGDPVITFVNRTYEPYRGIRQFMRALPALQERCPKAQVVLIGSDTPKVSYGAHRQDGQGWLSAMRAELGDELDWSRIHNLGRVRKGVFLQALQVSAAHVYLTYPFVLSWSLLEAMACGCLVIGSRTAPVEEVLENGHNGLLVDFFDIEAITNSMVTALKDPNRLHLLRKEARNTVLQKFQLEQCQQKLIQLVDLVAAGTMPTAS